jgi:hypothetical protein
MNRREDSPVISPTGALAAALLGTLLSSLLITGFLYSCGESAKDAIKATSPWQVTTLLEPINDDSWGPMYRAYLHKLEVPDGDIYDIYFKDRVKFQYPPSSLLLFEAFPRSLIDSPDGRPGPSLLRVLGRLSLAAVGITVLVSALILETALLRFFPDRFRSFGGGGCASC